MYSVQSNLWDPCLKCDFSTFYLHRPETELLLDAILDMVTESGSNRVMASVILVKQSRPTPTESNPRYFSNFYCPKEGTL